MFSTVLDAVVTFITDITFGVLLLNKRRAFLVFVVLAGVIYFAFFSSPTPNEEVIDKNSAQVEVDSIRNLSSDSSFTAVGSVSAVSEAKLQTESGGRVTAVYTTLGSQVSAGSIIAKLESASESAVLLQAQGAYEAALAGAASGDVGISQAENNFKSAQNSAVNTYKSIYTSVSGVLYGTVDQFYSAPDRPVPGVKLGSSNVVPLNSQRVELQTLMPIWKNNTLTITANSNLKSSLDEAEKNTKIVLSIVDMFIDIIKNEKVSSQYSEEDLRTLGITFNGVRAGLVANLNSINQARTSLITAEEAIKSAQIAGANNGGVSISGAQIKQALGSLRSAQANYEKTIVRTPISGVVNALYLKAGEYVSPSQPAAIIANNNNGLEINTAVSQEDSVRLKVGDMVTIDKIASGTVAAIGGAIDPNTGKVALKISVSDNSGLQNGTTVSVSFSNDDANELTTIRVPLSAVKMTGTGPVVFTVDNEVLVSHPVVLGPVSGASVEVTEGIDLDTQIVLDGRGLKEGQNVTVKTN